MKEFVENHLNHLITQANEGIKSVHYNQATSSVIAECTNGHIYTIDTYGDSKMALVHDVVNFLRFK